jgi:myxalamid-type polyketide synthase MxaE and MxaD
MANQGARRFILMGRTELPPRAQWHSVPAGSSVARKISVVRELESLGASVHVAPVDVANEDELRAYLDAFDSEGWPPIVGVIHAAGVADDYLISKLTDDALMDVLEPKVTGGWLLHNLLGDVELFVLFSSIGGLLGLPGQANYAAANTFLNSLAAYRRSLGLHTIAIDWGVWKDLGFALREGGQVTASHLSEMGVESFAADDGFAALAALLAANTTHSVVVPANWAQYTASRQSRRFPLLTHLMGVSSNASAKSATTGTSLHNQLLSAPAETRGVVLKTYLRDIVGQILRISSAKIKHDEALGSYGINSLMGMELRNRLERDLGLTLSATLVWNYPTIETMSAYLIERLGLVVQTSPESSAGRDTPSMEEPALGNIIADVNLLSDDDILKELMDKS